MPNPFTLPPIPAELQAIIDADRERFAGWQMMADPPEGGDGGKSDPPDGGKSDAGKNDAGDGDEELGVNGVKTLEKERAKRKELEKKIAGLESFQTQFTEFVTGLTGGEKASTTEEGLEKVSGEVSALKHELLVERVAREHGITAADDVEMLRELKTEDAIRKLAARLKPADDKAGDGDKGKGGRRQRPDPSAGKGGGGGDNGGKPGSVAEVMAARRADREAKSKTN